MKLRHIALLPSAVWVLTAAQAPSELLKSTLEKMDAASVRFKGMTADVKEIGHLDAINEDDTQSGTVVVKRANPKSKELHLRVDFTEPDRRLICFADRRGEVYNPKENSVQIYDLSRKDRALAEQFLLLGFGSAPADMQSSYSIALGGPEMVNGQQTVRLILTPKAHDQLGTITKVELWISVASDNAGLAVQQKFWEKGKDYHLTVYSNMKLNASISDSAVRCNIPKDAHQEHPLGH